MEDDDVPQLSASTLAALQSFLCEQKSRPTEADDGDGKFEMVKENWGMSQFWYDDNTSKTVVDELQLLSAGSALPIACIACPSLYTKLKKSYSETQVRLFEYDKRFSRYGADFVFYDYNQPLDIPHELHHAFNVVVADPPYLSKECLEKTVETMKYLVKDPETSPLLLLTGSVQRTNALELLKAQPCHFRPVHTNKLGNEFMLFTNYDPQSRLGGWEAEV